MMWKQAIQAGLVVTGLAGLASSAWAGDDAAHLDTDGVAPLSEGDATARVVGRWQTIDDKSGQPGVIIRTFVDKGKLYGAVEKILKPGIEPNRTCDKCSGSRKDKPVVGMVVMWGLEPDGDTWGDGRILDPESGDIYRCKLKASGADSLEVRGFIGISLMGRTQTWTRVK